MKLRTRGPRPSEPRPSAPIYVHFGMTKGALIGVSALTVAWLASLWIAGCQRTQLSHESARNRQAIARINSLSNDNRRALLRTNRLVTEGVKAHAGLCAIRRELVRSHAEAVRRNRETAKFIAGHPGGFAGLPSSFLEASYAKAVRDAADQAKIIASLGMNLTGCPP